MTELNKIFKSFYYAIEGIKTGFIGRNFKFHLIAALAVIVLGIYINLTQTEWFIITILISLVISAELFNSAIEEVCNLLNAKLKLDYFDTWNPRNLSAGAVLVVSIAAAIIGLIIFGKRIIG